jgi:hypothetical protein
MEQPAGADHVAPDPAAATGGGRGAFPLILALGIAAVFAAILLGTIEFPARTHADELSKVQAIITLKNSYAHPVLMLELVRAANALAGLTNPQAVAELGRAIAVLVGAAAVFVTFLLAREVLPAPAALAAAAVTAVTPLVAMHARYLKEDIFVLLFILVSLLALIRTLKSPTNLHVLLLGAAIGLAAAAKYAGIILVPFAAAALWIGLPELDRRTRLKLAGQAALAALGVFVLLHLPALWEFRQFASSVQGNLRNAETGTGVRVPLALTYGLFHLRHSLLPGLGAPLTVLGLLGFAAPLLAPLERRKPLIVIAAFAALWLVAHEASPFKPYPNFQRYMVPVAPLLIILGTALVYELAQRRLPRWSGAIAAAVILLASLPALLASYRITGPPEEDLRAVIPQMVLDDTPDAAFDNYTRLGAQREQGQSVSHGKPEPEGTRLLVTSSFIYDRYGALAASQLQSQEIRRRAARYAELFGRPYLEISNGRPSFAFFNPVFRIVALDGDAAHLQRLAGELRAKHPNLSMTLVNVRLP